MSLSISVLDDNPLSPPAHDELQIRHHGDDDLVFAMNIFFRHFRHRCIAETIACGCTAPSDRDTVLITHDGRSPIRGYAGYSSAS